MISINSISDNLVYWDSYSPMDKVVSWFEADAWRRIAKDIDGENELAHVLLRFPQYIKGYIIKRRKDSSPLGFIYLFNEDFNWGTVSIHGGACRNCSSFEIYRGYIMILEALLKSNIKVHTACSISNSNALRLNYSVGFVRYNNEGGVARLWINYSRLISTPIYKRIKGNAE